MLRIDRLERLAVTTGEEAIVIGMLRDFRKEVTERFDQLDEREDRQDDRIAAIETRDAVAVAVAKAAADAAEHAAKQNSIRWGRMVATATFAGTMGVALANIALRVLGL
jgi:hypothetical protein